jgi:excisionase family DNA binding protein
MQKDRLTNAYATETQASETRQGVARRGEAAAGRFLTVADIAQLLHCSPRTIHELTRTCRIPHRRIEGTRRCLFVPDEVDAWVDGAELYVSETPGGGRVVRPNTKARRSARTSQAPAAAS